MALTCCKTAWPWIPCGLIQLMTLTEPWQQFYPCLATAEGGNLQSNNNRCQGPHGDPGSRVPLGRSPKYLINIRHVGYQFYSVFSTENKYCVDTSLRFQISLQQGDPWGSLGPLGGVSKEPNIIRWPYVRAKMLLRGHII